MGWKGAAEPSSSSCCPAPQWGCDGDCVSLPRGLVLHPSQIRARGEKCRKGNLEEKSPLVQGQCPERRAMQQLAGGARFVCSAAECWAWHHELCIACSLPAQGFLVQAQAKQRMPLHCSEHPKSITPKRSAASCHFQGKESLENWCTRNT